MMYKLIVMMYKLIVMMYKLIDMMYKLMLPEEHDVQVTHFITSRGTNVGSCVLASAVVGAAGGQDVLTGVHGLHLGHGVEGLRPLWASPGDFSVLVTLLIVHIAGDDGAQRVGVGPVGKQVQRHRAGHLAQAELEGGRHCFLQKMELLCMY